MLDPYSSLKQYNQFVIWKLVTRQGKQIKLPCDPNGVVSDAHNPDNHLSFESATYLADFFHGGFGVGFVFTENDPFWVVDIDGAYSEPEGWTPLALELIKALPGALVEISQSGRGLHIIGSGVMPPHAKKNTALHIECYSELRFLAIGRAESAHGDAGSDLSAYLPALVAKYFTPAFGSATPSEWTTEADAEWNGYATDEELITKMIGARTASAVFGGALTAATLWAGDVDALSKAFPSESGDDYDRSSADASLAQRLAFYTGKHCERIERIMLMSGLVREKWSMRPDYLQNTILRACTLQIEVFKFAIIDTAVVEKFEPTPLVGKSEAQVAFAEQVRAEMLAACTDLELGKQLCTVTDPSFWLENRGGDLAVMGRQMLPATALVESTEVQYIDGSRLTDREEQLRIFDGCVYMRTTNEIFCPTKEPYILSEKSFNGAFNSRDFMMDYAGGDVKPTKKAFEAFTQSRLLVWPQAVDTCFKPKEPFGALIDSKVNMYRPEAVLRLQGDPSLFLRHLSNLFPIERDRQLVLAYMAACVQHIGTKFQWAPLIQGTQGNGKTLLSLCVVEAVGWRYSHCVDAADIGNKFNSWLEGNVFYYVEDIFVAEHKAEVLEALKPMITSAKGMSIQKKGKDQHTADICGNFIFNSNHKNAIRKTKDDRRFAVFFSAQQSVEDLTRDGMGAKYFATLMDWLYGKGDYTEMGVNYGFGIVSEYLFTYPIPPEFNPAGECRRAPITSSTTEAFQASMGGVEQEIVEAIEEGRHGFSGGWVSSFAIDELLAKFRAEKAIPQNKRRDLLKGLGYDLHPALKDGRVNNPLPSAMGKKPRLYIRDGHPHCALINGGDVARAYEDAQNWAVAHAAFGVSK